jgi:hypothetical protein
MTNLDHVFVNGFHIQFMHIFPHWLVNICLMCWMVFNYNLEVMVMIWTNDYPIQCKVCGLMNSSYSSCKWNYHVSRWSNRSANIGLVEYHDKKLQNRYPPII